MKTLERISITGFKSIRELGDFNIRQLNVLVGANGAGKTNLITLFKFLNRLIERRLQVYVAQSGGAEVFLHFGRKVTDEIAISLEFSDGDLANGYQAKLISSAKGNLFFAGERYWAVDRRYSTPPDTPLVTSLGEGHEESKLSESGLATDLLTVLPSWQVYHFHDTSDSARVKGIGDIGDNAILRPDAANLAAYLYLLKNIHPGHYERILSTIRLAAPYFDNFVLRPMPENQNKIRLEWRERASDEYLDASYLSDGTLRFICLATLLLQPSLPSLIIIDEPELGLHPYAINLLADMLHAAATKTQVIVSTQSVSFVDQFQPEDIIVVERPNAESTFKRLDSEQLSVWLDEFSIGEIWEMNLVGGRPRL
jgi:predicted ATPase